MHIKLVFRETCKKKKNEKNEYLDISFVCSNNMCQTEEIDK